MDAKSNKRSRLFNKLSQELIDRIVSDIQKGSTQRLAAESNGITESIFYVWIAQGRIDITDEKDSLCKYFVESLAKIKKLQVQRCIELIGENEKGHKGAEWILEHAYMRDFSSNAEIQLMAQELAELRAQLEERELQDEQAKRGKKKQAAKK